MVHNISDLKSLISKHNLNHLEANILKASRPCLKMKMTPIQNDEIVTLGTSRFGGHPDVPKTFEWLYADDRPLTFMAQFRLSDFAQYSEFSMLPAQGMLYFFYEADAQPWGDYDDKEGSSVIYIQDENTPLHRLAHPIADGEFDEIKALAPHYISFEKRLSLPNEGYNEPQYVGLSITEDEDVDAYINLLNEMQGDESRHQLFGYPSVIQYFIEWESMVYSKEKAEQQSLKDKLVENRQLQYDMMRNWQFLFQIDSDDDLDIMWGDVGIIYISIPKDSLAKKQFEDSWTILQCY